MDIKYVCINRTCRICYSEEVLEMLVYPSLTKIKSQAYNRILLSHYERIFTLSLMFMTSYLCNKSARGPDISENDPTKYDDNSSKKSENRKC